MGSQTPYRLRVEEVTPAALQPGDVISSTTNGATFWTFTGRPGQVVQISLNAAEGSGLDPLVRMFDPSVEQIDSDDDGGPGFNSLLTTVLPGSAQHLVQADRYGGSGGFALAAQVLPTATLPLDGATVDLDSDRAWTVEGEMGQVLTIAIVDGGDGSYTSVKLFTADGRPIGFSGGSASLVAVLPRSGIYIVVPRFDLDYESNDALKATLTSAADDRNLNDSASQTLYSLATGGAIDLALELYRWGTTDGVVQFTPDARMALCWHGALRGAALAVREMCEDLPDPSETTDRSVLAQRYDVRGVARALTGDIDGAIADFENYAMHGYGEFQRAQRAEWTARLRAGEPVSEVLDEATLRDLLSQ
jgi:hypothetical protein